MMDEAEVESYFSRIANFIECRLGLHFPENRWNDLQLRLNSAAQKNNFQNLNQYIERILAPTVSKSEIEELIGYLTIGETYFFRENKSLEIFQNEILPEIIQSRRGTNRTIRIWSAGCATGEEAYTIAMILDRVLPQDEKWNVTLLASDINVRALKCASEGVYSSWSFRETPSWIKQHYFNCVSDGYFAVVPQLKKYISFVYLNLAEDAYPSLTNNTNAMDAIFCRNVLMYFSSDCVRRVLENLYRSLTDGGWLVVSPTECLQLRNTRFSTVSFPNVFMYRKDGSKTDIPITRIAKVETSGNSNEEWKTYFPVEIEKPGIKLEEIDRRAMDLPETKVNQEAARKSHYDEAATCYAQGLYGEAITLLTTNHKDDTFTSKDYTLLAKCYANQGRLDEAAAFSECAIALDKTEPEHHYLHATIQIERTRTREAIASLKRTLYLDPNFTLAEVALGSIALQEGNRRVATSHFKNALRILAKYPHDKIISESDGITAGRWIEILESTLRIESGSEKVL